jgi:hypothetical protein
MIYFALNLNAAIVSILPANCTLRYQEFNALLNREQLENAINLSYTKSRKVKLIKDTLSIDIGKRKRGIKSLVKGDEVIVPNVNDGKLTFTKFTLV